MKRDYSRKDLYRRIIVLAWPAIVEQILVMTVGVVSTAFVGRIGTPELAAVGLISMLLVFIQTIFAGLATGATVVIARLTGQGDTLEAKKALIQSLLLGIFFGIVVTIPAFLFATPLLGLFLGSSGSGILDIGLTYYPIVMVGTPFFVVDLIVAGAVRGSGDTKTPMLVTLAANVLNIILGAVLIFGLRSGATVLVPAFGVAGAAFAVMTTRIFAGSTRILLLFVKKGALRLTFLDRFALDAAMIARIVKVGLPAFLEQLVMQGGFLIMQLLIMSLGLVSYASYQVSINVNAFAFMPIFGFAIATTTMVGQSLGRRDLREAEICAFESNIVGVVAMTILGALIFSFARPLASIYSSDPAVIAQSMTLIRLFAVLDPFVGIMNVSAGVLRAAGDIVYVMVTAVVGLWLFRILVAWSLGHFFGLGVYGVMAGIALDFFARSIMYGLRVRAGRWKTLRV